LNNTFDVRNDKNVKNSKTWHQTKRTYKNAITDVWCWVRTFRQIVHLTSFKTPILFLITLGNTSAEKGLECTIAYNNI